MGVVDKTRNALRTLLFASSRKTCVPPSAPLLQVKNSVLSATCAYTVQHSVSS